MARNKQFASVLLPTAGVLRAVGCLLLALVAALPGGEAAAKKVWSLSPDKGFVDDAIAFGGGKLAYIHTDSAKFLDVVLLDLGSLKPERKISLSQPQRVPKKLVFTPDGSKLLLVWMDGYSGKHGAVLLDVGSGKQLKEVKGKAHFAQVVERDGAQLLTLGTTHSDKRGTQRLTVDVHRTSDLRRIKSVRLSVAADRTLRRPKMRVLYFEPGHLSVVGQMRGEYDRKRDIRLPERVVRYDLLKRKIVSSKEPKELVDWTRAVNMRPNHPGQYRFLQVSDDLKTLFFIDRDNNLAKVATPVKWRLYEPKSLKQSETWDRKTVYFSITIDPVNPEAVARRKADKERADIYRLDPGPKATPLGRVLTGKRRFGWIIGDRHFVYLRKLKGFSRGGKTVELHTLSRRPRRCPPG